MILMKKQGFAGFADQIVGKIWICIVRSAGRKPSNALTPGPTRPTIGKGKERVSHFLPKIERGSHASWVLMVVMVSRDFVKSLLSILSYLRSYLVCLLKTHPTH